MTVPHPAGGQLLTRARPAGARRAAQHAGADEAGVRVVLLCRACGAAWADGERDQR